MGKDKVKDTEPNLRSATDLFEAIVNLSFLSTILFSMVALFWR